MSVLSATKPLAYVVIAFAYFCMALSGEKQPYITIIACAYLILALIEIWDRESSE